MYQDPLYFSNFINFSKFNQILSKFINLIKIFIDFLKNIHENVITFHRTSLISLRFIKFHHFHKIWLNFDKNNSCPVVYSNWHDLDIFVWATAKLHFFLGFRDFNNFVIFLPFFYLVLESRYIIINKWSFETSLYFTATKSSMFAAFGLWLNVKYINEFA